MSPERRAQIVAQSLENLHRYKSKLAADGISVDSPAARSADSFPAGRASSPEDPVERWRREGEELERQREVGRAQTRAEEERHIKGQIDATDLFWQSVDARIAAALDAERAFMTNLLSDALHSLNEIADATGDKFDDLDVKLGGLAKMLEQLRAGNESVQRARDKAESLDLPNPLPPRVVVN